ncbi:MAG: amidophosphoribosyltransferase [bacterium]
MKIGEECGIFGGYAYNNPIAPYIKEGLFMLQHRGQESAGVCCGDSVLSLYKEQGLVSTALRGELIDEISGYFGIGHVRYSTQGNSDKLHAQPYLLNFLNETVAISHNGNIGKAVSMMKELELNGEVFTTSSDTEMIIKKVIKELCSAPSTWDLVEVGKILQQNFSGGAWSILVALPERVFAYRDPLGYRPLFLCEAKEGIFLASEDSAFQNLTINKVFEIQAGQAVEVSKNGYRIERFHEKIETKQCVFEHIYFSRPDSNVFGRNVYLSRVELGKTLAKQNKTNADIVVPVMDSGLASSIGYSQESGIPLQIGLLRNHWVGRTFIQPRQKDREKSVRQKLIPIKSVIENQRIILVDDSLVRGTTSKILVKMIREAGAKEIHFKIASPMIVNTCGWGVDIPDKEQLIAEKYSKEQQIADFIGADSVEFIHLQGLKQYFGQSGWCYNCFERNSCGL